MIVLVVAASFQSDLCDCKGPDPCRILLVIATRTKPAADPCHLITHHSSRSQVSKELGIQLFAMLVQNGL
mgnify:CR=1 FL=1